MGMIKKLKMKLSDKIGLCEMLSILSCFILSFGLVLTLEGKSLLSAPYHYILGIIILIKGAILLYVVFPTKTNLS